MLSLELVNRSGSYYIQPASKVGRVFFMKFRFNFRFLKNCNNVSVQRVSHVNTVSLGEDFVNPDDISGIEYISKLRYSDISVYSVDHTTFRPNFTSSANKEFRHRYLPAIFAFSIFSFSFRDEILGK